MLNDDDPSAAAEDAPNVDYDAALDLASDVGADDLNEAERLSGYWRMDEGEGLQIADVTDNKMNCVFESDKGAEAAWSSEPLETNDPMDIEDKWGKTN